MLLENNRGAEYCLKIIEMNEKASQQRGCMGADTRHVQFGINPQIHGSKYRVVLRPGEIKGKLTSRCVPGVVEDNVSGREQ